MVDERGFKMTKTTEQTVYNEQLEAKLEEIFAGGHPKYHEKLKEQNKLFVRDRLELLFDDGKYTEDGRFANCEAGDFRQMVSSLQWGK